MGRQQQHCWPLSNNNCIKPRTSKHPSCSRQTISEGPFAQIRVNNCPFFLLISPFFYVLPPTTATAADFSCHPQQCGSLLHEVQREPEPPGAPLPAGSSCRETIPVVRRRLWSWATSVDPEYIGRGCPVGFHYRRCFDGSSAKMCFTTKATQRLHKGHTTFKQKAKERPNKS